MRRKNAVVVMATQQISDIANSDIADIVLENCPTKILLPNAEAKSSGTEQHPGPREFYARVGLNERELDIVQVSIPKKHYYVISPQGRRWIDLGLGRVALSWVGVNGSEERRAVERVIEEHPKTWRAEWLRSKGLSDWAEYLSRLEKESEREEDFLCV
jgi:type IV secretion system protein VirB4